MKKHFTFSTGEHIEADLEDLRRLLRDNQQYYENYQDVLGSLEDDDYVEKYAQRVKEIQKWIIQWE